MTAPPFLRASAGPELANRQVDLVIQEGEALLTARYTSLNSGLGIETGRRSTGDPKTFSAANMCCHTQRRWVPSLREASRRVFKEVFLLNAAVRRVFQPLGCLRPANDRTPVGRGTSVAWDHDQRSVMFGYPCSSLASLLKHPFLLSLGTRNVRNCQGALSAAKGE